jgi:type VI secretion system secreted protein Hcp
MAVDLFLKITGIQGDSTDAKHHGEIVVDSFSWGESAGATVSGGGTPVTTPGEMFFTGAPSAAGPELFLACARRTLLPGAILTVRAAGPRPVEILLIFFGALTISSYHVSASRGSAGPAEQFSIAPTRMKLEFNPQGPGGPTGLPVIAGWDFLKHVQI